MRIIRRWMLVASACLLSGIYNPVLASYTYNRLGPAIPQNDPNCAGMKLNDDADVDQSDFGIFQRCYSGIELALPECTGAGGGLPASGTFVLHGRPVDALPDGHTLLYVRARYYDLKNGRWLQRDPLGNVAGPNLYEAFASNPEAVLDPMGTEPELRYEGSLKWEDGGAGVARIRVYNDGGYWGRSRNITVFELAVRSDVRGQNDPRTRAWVVLGEREYLVNISALRSWLEGLDEQHRAIVAGDPSSEFLASRLGESFAGTFGDRIYGILDVTTGQYLPGYNPNDPENIVQSTSEVRQGVQQAAAMGESGMRQVMYGFLFAAGAEVVGKGAQIVSQSRGMATGAGGVPSGRGQTPSGVPSRATVNVAEPTTGQIQIVERVMSRAELEATRQTGLLRGGRSGTHYVTDAANRDALRARQRLALPQTPEVRVVMEVRAGTVSPAKPVQPNFGMPGGGSEWTATGEVPVRILSVQEYRQR